MGLPIPPYVFLLQERLGTVNSFSVSIVIALAIITISLPFVLARLLGFL